LIAADIAQADVPTCGPRKRAGLLQRADLLVVVNEQRIVLGVIEGEELARAEPDATAEKLMHRQPLTIRPDVPLEQIVEDDPERRYLLVTNPDGVLLGVAWRKDVEERMRAVAAATEQGHEHHHG
jgi:predicted transcriptional regulator